MSKIWNPIRNRLTGSEQEQRLQLLASTPGASAVRETRVGTQPVTNTSPPGTPDTPIGYETLTPAQAESWLELVEIVFGEPFIPQD